MLQYEIIAEELIDEASEKDLLNIGFGYASENIGEVSPEDLSELIRVMEDLNVGRRALDYDEDEYDSNYTGTYALVVENNLGNKSWYLKKN